MFQLHEPKRAVATFRPRTVRVKELFPTTRVWPPLARAVGGVDDEEDEEESDKGSSHHSGDLDSSEGSPGGPGSDSPSDHSGSGDGGGGGPPPPGPGEGGGGGGGGPGPRDGLVFKPADCVVLTTYGRLVAYVGSGTLVAQCYDHKSCTLSRTMLASRMPGRAASGRPLGLLAAWLQARARPGMDSKDAHKNPLVLASSTLELRRRARIWMRTFPNGGALEAFERMRRPEEDEEPELQA